ncbi:MAG: phage portal protein [Bacteroidota bacterium]
MKLKNLLPVMFGGVPEEPKGEPNISSEYNGGGRNQWHRQARDQFYDGEKTPGELGNIVNLIPDYYSLRIRAYEQWLKNDIVRIICGKFFKWTVGSGLDLQSEPNMVVLEQEGVDTSAIKDFRKMTEARFKVYAGSKMSDYSRMTNLHQRANEAFQSGFIGGDTLNVLRVNNGVLSIQVFDGQSICSPFLTDPTWYDAATAKGNIILHGIEIDKKGTHVAFYVKKEQFSEFNLFAEFERIEARSPSTGLLMAWMYYGSKFRINHLRGISSLSSVLEKIDKLDRYTEAAVGSAEERAKIPFFIEHNRFSDGENPLGAKIKAKMGGREDVDPWKQGEVLSKLVAATTAKTVHNLPIGAKMNAIQTQTDLQYEPFFRAVFNQVCASMDIPPEVAMQLYNSNYSASRAAINGWGHIIEIVRKYFSDNFYQNVYNVWLTLEIINNKIKAPGFLEAMIAGNFMVLESYCNAKWTGVNMPHIDPKKEVEAVRMMLGDKTKQETPLISNERAAEILNQGDWLQNYKQWEDEQKLLPKEPIIVPPASGAAPKPAAAAKPAKKEPVKK